LKTVTNTTELQTNESGTAQAIIPANETKGTLNAEFVDDSEFSSNNATNRFLVVDKQAHQTGISVTLFFGAYYLLFILTKKKFGMGF